MTKLQHSFCALIVLLTGFVEMAGCTGPYNASDGSFVNSGPAVVHAEPMGINAGSPENISR